MAVNNSLVAKSKAQQNLGITAYLTQDAIKNQINKVVGGKNGQRFISAIVSAYNTNPTLQECTNQSILSAALLGESLQLSPSPQLGHYYMVPFNNTKAGIKEAQFQMGYKGYIQLAIRSGQYKRLNVVAIKEGELEYFDPLNEDIKVNLMVDDWDKREEAETIGYYAMFELVNGFRKTMYWSKAQMLAHADKYSQAFYKDAGKVKTKYGEKQRVSFADYEAGNYDPRDSWMYSSFWYKNFDGIGVSEEGDLDVKTVDVPYQARQAKLELDEKNIYRFGMGLNTAGLKDTSATTNIAIKAAYSLLDLKAKKIEKALRKFLRKIVEIVVEEINKAEDKAYKAEDVYFEFAHEIMSNAQENAQIELTEAQTRQAEINTILSVANVLDDETVVKAICDWLDIDYEEIKDKLPQDEGKDTEEAQKVLDSVNIDDENGGAADGK